MAIDPPSKTPVNAPPQTGDEHVVVAPRDARGVLVYLVAQESEQYIAVMEALESSIADLTPREVCLALQADGVAIDERTVEARLDKLREWGAVSARSDTSRILRFVDLLARNWRYTATPTGRHVQRFYRSVLAGTPMVREIPLQSLRGVVEAVDAIAGGPVSPEAKAELIRQLFVSHDDLDSALVGAEDSLAGLADRFDLSRESAGELKSLLVGYATHVAAELQRGSAHVYRVLHSLWEHFAEFAHVAVSESDARALIERGALGASRGGRVGDWEGLLAWFAPQSGRSARFGLRLVRALPGMHVNLRRLHSSSGTATSRGRALALAKACADPAHGTAIFLAAVGDHSWRKLHSESEELDGGLRPWRDGPRVEVPELLRLTGRSGARGRAPAARDDAEARAAVSEARDRRAAEHAAGIREVLAAKPGEILSERAARIAVTSLAAAARNRSAEGRRTGVRDGLACTLFHTGQGAGLLSAPTWRVVTPGRIAVFHTPGRTPSAPATQIHPELDSPHLLKESVE